MFSGEPKNGSSLWNRSKKKQKQTTTTTTTLEPLKECMIFQAILTFTFKWQLANLEFLLLPC